MTNIEHYQANQSTFDFWIERNEILQPSMDILQPLIKPFNERFPEVNINACHNCIIDMLKWSKLQFEKSISGTEQTKSKKKNK